MAVVILAVLAVVFFFLRLLLYQFVAHGRGGLSAGVRRSFGSLGRSARHGLDASVLAALPVIAYRRVPVTRRACLGLHQWRGRGSGRVRDEDSAVVGDRCTRTLGQRGRGLRTARGRRMRERGKWQRRPRLQLCGARLVFSTGAGVNGTDGGCTRRAGGGHRGAASERPRGGTVRPCREERGR